MNVDLDKLIAFAAFAEHLSFTAAAKQLAISQPALHVKIRKLGQELGVLLYTRQGRQLRLTEDGLRTLAFAREMAERSERFVASLQGVPDAPVRVCAGEGSWLYLLGPLLDDPPHPVAVQVADGPSTLAAVASAEAHIGVLSLDEPPDLESVLLAEVPLVVALPERHPLTAHPVLCVEDLDGVPLVLPPPGRPLREQLERALREADCSLNAAVEVRGWPLTLSLVARGLGVAVVNGFCEPPPGVACRPIPELPPRPYFAVRRSPASQAERLVWDALRRTGLDPRLGRLCARPG